MPQTQTITSPKVAEPKSASSGQIREIPVRPEVWQRSAAQELADPPRFPALK